MAGFFKKLTGGKNKINNAMIRQEALDLVLIIDRSGSMGGTEEGIIKGHGTLLEYLKGTKKKITLTTILFDDEIVIISDGQTLDKVPTLTYEIGGSTALFDALGSAIIHVNERKKIKSNPYPNADVLYLIVTDGYENESKLFTLQKLQELIKQEKMRTYEGHGTRSLAVINEFGLNSETFSNQTNQSEDNVQIFIRGNRGIKALFETVEYAADDVLENRRITKKWKEESDRVIRIGTVTLGEIKELSREACKMFIQCEHFAHDLLVMANDGLTNEFLDAYQKYTETLGSLKTMKCMHTGNKTVDQIIAMYVTMRRHNQGEILSKAITNTIQILASKSIMDLGSLRNISERKAAAAEDFYQALKNYTDKRSYINKIPAIIKKLSGTPGYDGELKERIKTMTEKQDDRYDSIISEAFKIRMVWLNDAARMMKKEDFWRLAEFADDPIAPLLKDVSSYGIFCIVANDLKPKMPAPDLKPEPEPKPLPAPQQKPEMPQTPKKPN